MTSGNDSSKEKKRKSIKDLPPEAQAKIREQNRLRKIKERSAVDLKLIGPRDDEKPKKFDPKHSQSKWNSDNGFIYETDGGKELISPKTETRQVFFCKNKLKGAAEWAVAVRVKDEGTQIKKYSDRAIALDHFLELSEGILPSDDWRTIKSYAQRASAFLLKAETGQKVSDLASDRLGFVMAAVFLRERGFEGLAAAKWLAKSTWKRKYGAQRRIYNHIGNVTLPKSLPEFRGVYKTWCEKLILQTEAVSGFRDQESYLKEVVEFIELYSDAFPGLAGCKGIREQIVEDMVDKYIKTSKTGRLRRTVNYKYIPVEDLTHILLNVLQFQHQFNSLILELSTGLRVEDCLRVLTNPELYIIDGTNFNYKGDGIENSEAWIVGKTGRKVDPSKLVNPTLSLISRIILRHKLPIGWTPFNPFVTAKRKAFGDKIIAKYPEKCVRATCATLLSYCELVGTVEEGKATRDTAAQRLGHVDTRTVVRTYAPRLPTEPDPFHYFGVDRIELDGEWVSEGSTLYDTYLLKMFMQFYQKKMSKADYSKLIDLIIYESRDFRRVSKEKTKSRTFAVNR